MTDPIVELVKMKLTDRSAAGMNKYGTTLMRDDIDHYGWLCHLQEELLDAVLYIERLKLEHNGNNNNH